MIGAISQRFVGWLFSLAVCFDRLVAVWLRGWVYVWIGGEAPAADESISAWVGRTAVRGAPWALAAEKVIDRVFGAGHCRRAAERYRQGPA